MKKNRLFFTIILSVLGISINAQKQKDKPNIIIIYSDDMGYGDVGYNGVEDIKTPNIDKLAHEGIEFTQGYVSASVCGPSRAGLLTGVYQQRFGMGENPSASGFPNTVKSRESGLPTTQTILPEILQENGYVTGMVGKWHLGAGENLRPYNRGFDFYYGFINGSHSYYKARNEFGKKKDFWPIFRNDKMEEFDGYLTDKFTEEAEGFIKKNKNKPFFLYLAYNAVHHPWQAPQHHLDSVANITPNGRKVFAAMTWALDLGVGEIRSTLKELGIDDKTIIIFISDNGAGRNKKNTKYSKKDPEWGNKLNSNGQLRGYKGDTHEGGIRVPFVIYWPNTIINSVKNGKKYTLPVSNLDITPTLLSYLNIDVTYDFDGVDILPHMTGVESIRPHEIMYWRRGDDYAIRKGDWKLSWNDQGKDSNKKLLFNLAEDPFEKNDLSVQEPDITNELQEIFDAWDCKLPNSKWWKAPINRKRN